MTNEEVEAALGRFVPAVPQIDRDALMYEAGYQAACGFAATADRRKATFWKATTGLMTAASVALAVVLAQRSISDTTGQVAAVDADPVKSVAASAEPATPSEVPVVRQPRAPSADPLLGADPSTNYLALRRVVLRRGIDAWPTNYPEPADNSRPAPPRHPSTVRGLMQELLPTETKLSPPADENLSETFTRNEESVV